MARDDQNVLFRLALRLAGAAAVLIVVFWVISGTMITVQADEIVIKQDVKAGACTSGIRRARTPSSGGR